MGKLYSYRFNGETRKRDEGMRGIQEERGVKDYLCYISTNLSRWLYLLLIYLL
jgi:hypothetical protein